MKSSCTLNHQGTRIYYLDFLRIFLTIVVFYHHAAISLGASGGWFYYVKNSVHGASQFLLSLNMGIDQSYFMSLFFFISAYFTPSSYDKKGARKFIYDRLNRLGLPLLIYMFVLQPFLSYFTYGYWGNYGFGLMWFVFALLIFELVYVIIRKSNINISTPKNMLKPINIIGFIVIMGLIDYVVRWFLPTDKNFYGFTLGYFPLYIVMYILGTFAKRDNWLDKLSKHDLYIWLGVVFIIAMPLLLVGRMLGNNDGETAGGFGIYSAAFALWESIMCVSLCFVFTTLSKLCFNYPNKMIHWTSNQTYAAYIIHPLILVACTLWLQNLTDNPLLNLFCVLMVGIPTCFIVASLFKKSMDLIKINV